MRIFETPGTLSSLMQFIRRNRALPDFLARPEAELAEPLTELQNAIQVADWQSRIFSHPECSLLLLKLLELQRISYCETISVYLFLMALMEFTDKQALAEQDSKLKWPLPICCVSLMRGKYLSDEGQDYLTALEKKTREAFGIELDKNDMTTFMGTLAAFEQLAMEVPCDENAKSTLHPEQAKIIGNAERLNLVLRINLPFTERYAAHYVMPGYSVLVYLLQHFSCKPDLKMLPCFGQMNPQTLAQLHQQGYHPLALYHPAVSSNLRAADGHAAGPSNIALHDIAHGFWGSWLNPTERAWIFEHFIPEIRRWQKAALAANKQDLAKRLAEAVIIAADFDLSPIAQYAHPESRLKHYLVKSLGYIDRDKPRLYPGGFLGQQNEFAPAGSLVQDWIYLLLLVKKNQSDDPNWRRLAHSIETGVAKRAKHEVIKIEAAALNAQSLGLAPEAVLSPAFDGLLRTPRRPQSLFEIQRADSPCWEINKYENLSSP